MTVERTLHHFPLDPFSRQARLVLSEKKLPYAEVIERYWEQRPEFQALNPAGVPPVLVETDTEAGGRPVVIVETRAILEYLEEVAPETPLMPRDPVERAEVRRILHWFDRKFDFDVNSLLLHEKMEKRLLGLGGPDMQTIRAGNQALRGHFGYLEHLLSQRDWLAGRRMTLADLGAAAHVSVIDYFGDCPWRDFPGVKTWYMALKSRPSFRSLLADRHPGVGCSPHYRDLDF
jgi:glutathione S-transferase